MSERTFNVNELLERKKQLEDKEKEMLTLVTKESLEFRQENIIDYTNNKANRTLMPRPKVSLTEYMQVYNGVVDELSKVKGAIQKFNADSLLGEIYLRDNARKKLVYLERLKALVPREKKFGNQVTRQDKDGVALERIEVTIEPMFSREEIDNQFDEIAAQERKTNTNIQRKNLEAKISL